VCEQIHNWGLNNDYTWRLFIRLTSSKRFCNIFTAITKIM